MDMEKWMRARLWFYHFFAVSLLKTPSAENFSEFVRTDGPANVPEAASVPGFKALFRVLQEMEQYTRVDWEVLAKEYQRIFPSSGLMLVYPWESVYLSREHILFDEHTLEVRRSMAAWNVAADSQAEPADHIGLELSFLSVLTRKLLDGLAAGDTEAAAKNLQAQLNFLSGHLLLFSPEFCQKLCQITRHPFYRELAGFMEHWLPYDFAALTKAAAAKAR